MPSCSDTDYLAVYHMKFSSKVACPCNAMHMWVHIIREHVDSIKLKVVPGSYKHSTVAIQPSVWSYAIIIVCVLFN